MEDFHKVQKKQGRGFQGKVVSTVGRADKSMPGILLVIVIFGLIEGSDSFLQSLCKAERWRRDKQPYCQMWSNTICNLLNAILELRDCRPLSTTFREVFFFVLKQVRERLCSTQLEKGIIS